MRTSIRRLCVGASAVACFGALSGTALASTHAARLLARYQPVTVMDPSEAFAPTSVATFVADADLETQTGPNAWELLSSTPTLGSLPAAPTAACATQGLLPCYRLNQHDCTAAAGTAGVACSRADWLDPAPRSVVYARAFHTRRTTILQYWYFYYDDLYSYRYPPDDFIWQAHEGDWENVTVLLRRGAEHPRWVGYSQHCTGERRGWRDTPRWHGSTHPVVDVGIGSHANFFATGEHAIATQCIPPDAIAFLEQKGLALPDDHSHAGQAYGPAAAAGVKPTAIERVTGTRPGWMRFAGTWGDYQFFHGPDPIGTVISGLAPATPPASALWQHPVKTVIGWPRTG
jgi:hypothetical protein